MSRGFGALSRSHPTDQAPAGLGASRFDRGHGLCDQLIAQAEQRHAWLIRAGEQIRRWKAEDAANGQPWGEDQ